MAYREPVYRLLYRLARDPHDAEDLLQETFSRLWQKRRQFRGDGCVGGYIRQIAYRTYLNARPRLARGRDSSALPDEVHDAATPCACAVERADLEHFLLGRVQQEVERLPESWREAFVLYRYEGLSCREVAAMMDITTKAVEMRVAKALKRIAGRLADLRQEYSVR